MSSPSMQTIINPVIRHKMPLFDGTIAPTGLSKPQNMSDFLSKQALQYGGAYFAYDPRGKDGARFTSPWSKSKTSVLDGANPVSHLSGTEGQSHIIYRQDSNSSEEGHPHSSSLHHPQAKQGFTLYTKSPGMSSPTAATSVAVRKQKSGGDGSSPPPEHPVYLAIPKPVYGHNPCCNKLSCVMGQQYSMERGSPRIPNPVYEYDWMPTDAHYAERLPVQRRAQEALQQQQQQQQQRGLQFEPGAEPLKRIPVETCSLGQARALPAMIDPNYAGYPCTLTRTLFGSLSEQSLRLETSPRGYPSLHPSHPTYEHMTSEVYQEHSPMSKYGQLTHLPMFYYPQANVEVESRTQCKDTSSKQREDVPVILKHTLAKPREHYIVPQPLHGEMPLPLACTEMLPNHPLMRGFEYPCYAVPRFSVNARSPFKSPHAYPRVHINVPASSQYVDHPMASATNLHRDEPSPRQHATHPQNTLPFLRVDQTSPTRRKSEPGISPTRIQNNRFFPTLPNVHIERPIPSPKGLNVDRLQDYSTCETQLRCMKQTKGLQVSPTVLLSPSVHHSTDVIRKVGSNGSSVRKIIYSPVAHENNHSGPRSNSGPAVVKVGLKRSISHSSSPIKIKEEQKDLCEVELVRKRQKLEMAVLAGNNNVSPPMPVIDTVFSLAPYQMYLQRSGVLFPGKVPLKTTLYEQHEVKTKGDIREHRQDQDDQQSVSKETCENKPIERPIVEACEPKIIKVEKEDPQTDTSVAASVIQRDCSNVKIKKEPDETCSPDFGHMLVIKKCEPDEFERTPTLDDKNEISDDSNSGEATAQMTSLPQGDPCTPHERAVTPQTKPITPPQPPEGKIHFKNIPPHCLKLSTYNIVLRDPSVCSSAAPLEKPPAQPTAQSTPQVKPQVPVRKHFLELHHSLYKLVCKSVSTSSEEELRTWLSQLDLTEPASPSPKVQKVSCLLGSKAREAWLNKEIKSALHKLLERLTEYTAQERCPFPHVMRAGAVFLPMLVVKELLFPMVQGSFIDQVLQEHKVELRPTTLSEEKILIQLHKRACSSRLRRLMSLKHLPDIYADVVNLLYYTSVCKHLGLDMEDPVTRDRDGGCEDGISCRAPALHDISASESHPHKDDETKSNSSRNRTKSRVKSSSRRMFLDNGVSDEEAADDTDKTIGGGVLDAFSNKNWSGQCTEDGENEDAEQESSPIPPGTALDNSWTCPLTFDEIPLSPGDPETEDPSSPRPVSHFSGPSKSQIRSNGCSGVILKLRRMFSKGLSRKKARYQAVSDSGTFADPSHSQSDEEEGSGEMNIHRRKVTHRWQRTGSFSHSLRPLSSSSKRKRRSLLKIKYCPYLSACHSAEHRRRWVLRSAVQRAQRAMRLGYPDLVGKRIRHLYEEDDKSEVWYRGEVLRVHEAHTNPLKTIFEVRYDSEPEWKYYLELLIDYKKGWLKIED